MEEFIQCKHFAFEVLIVVFRGWEFYAFEFNGTGVHIGENITILSKCNDVLFFCLSRTNHEVIYFMIIKVAYCTPI